MLKEIEMEKNSIVIRVGERLSDNKGDLIGWIADDGKFHPCGAALTKDQLQAILSMLDE